MARRTLYEQLDEALDAMIAGPDAPTPRVGPKLSALLKVAADLRDLPRAEFKARLAKELASGRVAKRRVARARKPSRAARATSKSFPVTTTAIPCLVVSDGARAIDFYKEAFGAKELMRLEEPGTGKLWHAEIQIGNSPIALSDEFPEHNLSPQSIGGTPVILQLNVEDADAFARQAVAAGAKIVIPVADQFYGQRGGRLADPFGHLWIVSSKIEDVPIDEMRRRAREYASQEREKPAQPGGSPRLRAEAHLRVKNAARLIDFIKNTFGAEEIERDYLPDGTLAHSEIRIGDSAISAGDASGANAPMPTALHLYVPDVDSAYARAIQHGSTSLHEPMEMEYGERGASVSDPFGNHWYLATHHGASHVPQGLGAITPYLHPGGADDLIDFLKRAFGAEEQMRVQPPGDVVHHAKLRIGESVLEMGEAHGPYGNMPTVFHLYVDDTDSVYRRAIEAGALSLEEPSDRPWGMRGAGVQDPAGNQWWINTPISKKKSAHND